MSAKHTPPLTELEAELLEALEHMVEVFGRRLNNLFSQREAINRGRAAIAKAKEEAANANR